MSVNDDLPEPTPPTIAQVSPSHSHDRSENAVSPVAGRRDRIDLK
jgi:hypothetical protein